jgi:hypothetical protein
MKDIWQEHFSLEITHAVGDDERMMLIAQTLIKLDRDGLIPEQISEPLFNQLARLNGD